MYTNCILSKLSLFYSKTTFWAFYYWKKKRAYFEPNQRKIKRVNPSNPTQSQPAATNLVILVEFELKSDNWTLCSIP